MRKMDHVKAPRGFAPGVIVMLTCLGSAAPAGTPCVGATGICMGPHDRPGRWIVDFFNHRDGSPSGRWVAHEKQLVRLTMYQGIHKQEQHDG